MLRDAFAVFSRAFDESLRSIGQSQGAILFGVLAVACTLTVAYSRRGAEAAKWESQDVLNGLPGLLLAFLVLLAWHMVRVPHAAYITQKDRAAAATMRVSELELTLAQKRQTLDTSDPAFHNMTGVVRSLMSYRRAIGQDAQGRLLVTAARDATPLAGSFIQFAVLGSGIANGDLQNIGIRPENVEAIEREADVAGRVVLHALPDSKGVDSLVSDLSNLMQIERSYKMPVTSNPIPENVIWFHFGPGAKWNTERK